MQPSTDPHFTLSPGIALDREGSASGNEALSTVFTSPCLRDVYCSAHGVPTGEFETHFLSKVLHKNARLFYPWLRNLVRGIDKGDMDFLADLGFCRDREDIRRTLSRLPHYYQNWNFWRRVAKLRISSRLVLAHIAKFPQF